MITAAAALNPSAGDATVQPPSIATHPRILEEFYGTVAATGLAGERQAVLLLYLAVTSRLLDRIVSVAVKGPSAGGKSHLVETVLEFFPPEAYYALTAMSDRALAYDKEPLAHRVLVIYEATGLSSEIASYLMRSLLSEGRLRYVTVAKTKGGALESLSIERAGPTGLIVTTTAANLHAENETRLLTITVTDSPAQTRSVLVAQANEVSVKSDTAPWRDLQRWLAQMDNRVTIPFATALAQLIPPVAVRLRRDFPQLLALIRAHAVLHQHTRERDADGRIVASIEDYAAVRELVDEVFAEAVERAVSPVLRETVRAVVELCGTSSETTSLAIARHLGIDKSAASRRVKVATARGYLKNLEDRRGRPARLIPGEPLPDEERVLPTEDRLHSCTANGEVDRPGTEADDLPVDAEQGIGCGRHECQHDNESDCGASCETQEQILLQLSALRGRAWSPVPGGAHVEPPEA